MTIDERLDRIVHDMPGLAEERRKHRKEYRQLWWDTQRQLSELAGRVNELTVKLAEANDAITRLADETKGFAEESRAGEKRLEKRIDTLVSTIGQFLSALPKPPSAT